MGHGQNNFISQGYGNTKRGGRLKSGVPTFPETQIGLWVQCDPQELATPEAFQANPQLVWEW